jgi:hypothetical protein
MTTLPKPAAALGGLAILCFVATGALAQADFLTGDQVADLIGGHALDGTLPSGDKFAEKYATDGKIKGVWNGSEIYDGKWKVKDDSLCLDYAGSAYDFCYRVAHEGDTVSLYRDGGSDYVVTAKYLP